MTVQAGLSIRRMAICAVMAAVICVIAPISVPIGPISITGATFAIYLTVYLLGDLTGTVSVLVYLLVGFAGLPVFSNYTGGAARLLGPTGGYLVGYLPMALLSGLVIQWAFCRFGEKDGKGWITIGVQVLGMAAGTAVLYALGTAWYCVQAGVGLRQALDGCVLPFIPFDLLKMAAALLVGVPVRRRLEQAKLLQF